MKTKITSLVVVVLCSFLNYAQTQEPFIHCTTVDNTINDITALDDPALNDNPNAVVFVQKMRYDNNGTIIRNPHEIAVKYDGFAGKWVIEIQNGVDMPLDSCYMIYICNQPFYRHKVGVGTILPGFDTTTVLDNPALNDNSSARSMVTKVVDADEVTNDNSAELYYNWQTLGKWYIATQIVQSMPIDAAFNILTNPLGFAIYEHYSTFANTDRRVVAIDDYAYWTILDHALLNNNPNALLFATHRREPATGFFYWSLSVFYNSVSGRWELHMELPSYADAYFPTGRYFDIFIFDSALSVNDVTLEKDVKIFPNPTNTIFNIQAKGTVSEVSLYNILGQEMEKISGKRTSISQIDVSNYKSGTYFVKVRMNEKMEIMRVVKN